MVILQANNIQYKYQDGTHALRGVSMEIEQGEFLAILGPNGSGKTTLLKHFNGLLKIQEGEVLLDGRSLKNYPSREVVQRVGIVFQDPNDQLFAQTVREDVAFGPMNLGLSKEDIERRVEDALTLVNMSHCADKFVGHLSYGQKKRVCIAGVLAMKPEVLLLDEPTSGLDPAGVTHLMRLLQKLNSECGITIIMATNVIDVVPVYMSSMAVMYEGTVLHEGTPENVFSKIEELEEVYLELPQIAQLMRLLRDKDKISMEKLPLTIGEARKFLIQKLNGEHVVRLPSLNVSKEYS
ncbi:MAG: ATP-binding cassette domain-containing protein [Candidatus Kuenenia sp.]|nr:ATP-binding cassette domain-containing protein [Candidatus Kuenenia hertensis]